jgi:ParB family chromosome partitioning protein
VEKGVVPITAAISIATASDKELQKILQDAYEEKKLKGTSLKKARKLIQDREMFGKGLRSAKGRRRRIPKSTRSLVKTYEKEVLRQQLLVKKANICERRFLFVVTGLRECFNDENFVNLLRAEGLTTLPGILAERIDSQKAIV